MDKLSVTFSLAEQSFSWTRSIGVLNLSVSLLESIATLPEVEKITVLSNESFRELKLPPSTKVLLHNEANGRGAKRLIWDQVGIYNAARRAGNEWLFLPKGFASFVRRPPVSLATYVHDLMFEFYSERYPPNFNHVEGVYLRNCIKGALRHARVIFTNSQFTADHLAETSAKWGITPPPIHAVGIGFAKPQIISAQKQDRILVATSRWPHKRTDLTLAYLDSWQKKTQYRGTVDLVGGLPSNVTVPAHANWQVHARVPEAKYRDMMVSARVLVYSSEFEGFGMPPVEATLAGACPVYSKIPACSEAMMNLGFPFLNERYESFADAMETALKTDPATLEQWSKQLLQKYSWESVARNVTSKLITAPPR